MNDTSRSRASILVALLACGLILKGGVHARHMGWLVALFGLIGFSVLFAVNLETPKSRLSQALIGCFAFGITLQLVPMPDGIRSMVSPGTQEVFRDVSPLETEAQSFFWETALLHDFAVETGDLPTELVFESDHPNVPATGAHPGSLEPYKTQWSLAIWLTAGLVFLMATALARKGQAQWILMGIFWVCVAEAFWGIANRHGGSLGLFPKQHYLGAATGTLVNANHFASLMLLGLGAGAASFQIRTGRDGRFRTGLLWAGMVLCGAGLVLSQSRAGLMIGCIAAACAHGLLKRNKRVVVGWSLVLMAVGAYVLTLSGPDALVGLETGLDPSFSGRLGMLSHSFGEWKGFWLTGSGLGTFSWVARLGQETPYLFHFSHLHNDWLQLFVEGGLLIGLPIVYFFGQGFRAIIGRLKEAGFRPDEVALTVSLGALALHAFVDFPLQIPAILLVAATMAGVLWGTMTPHHDSTASGPPVVLIFVVAFLALVGLQSAKRDGIIAGNLALLENPPERLAEVEAQLSRELPGARKGLGRLAFTWSARVADEKGPQVGLDASIAAADAARRRSKAQPLDAAAHLAEASSLAMGSALLRKHQLQTSILPEEMLAATEHALSRALSLEPTNPLVLLEVARIQLQLSRWSPLKKGHKRRAALALKAAIDLDPWASSNAYRLTDQLDEKDFLLVSLDHPQAHFEMGLGWQRRGRTETAETQFRKALAMDKALAGAHFALGGILRNKKDPEFKFHLRQYLAFGNLHSGMGAWSVLWLGETDRAATLFEGLLLKEPNRRWLKNGLEQAKSTRQ